jgi:uncharacterized protein with GYD domain
MAHFMLSLNYSTQSKQALLANPTDRTAAATVAAKALGGKLICGYGTLGKYDMIAIAELPGPAEAAALSAALGASGGFDCIETTTLLTAEEMMAAVNTAKKSLSGYKPPGK